MSYKKLIPFINGENELAANVVTQVEKRNAELPPTHIVETHK